MSNENEDIGIFSNDAPKLLGYLQNKTDNMDTIQNIVTIIIQGNLELATLFLENIKLFKRLNMLYIQNCGLTSLPKEIDELQKLRILQLNGNQLTELPDSIGKLIYLTGLNLNTNQLIKLPDSIGKLQKLEYLSLYTNQLTELPDSITQLTNLKNLDLCENNDINNLDILNGLNLTHYKNPSNHNCNTFDKWAVAYIINNNTKPIIVGKQKT